MIYFTYNIKSIGESIALPALQPHHPTGPEASEPSHWGWVYSEGWWFRWLIFSCFNLFILLSNNLLILSLLTAFWFWVCTCNVEKKLLICNLPKVGKVYLNGSPKNKVMNSWKISFNCLLPSLKCLKGVVYSFMDSLARTFHLVLVKNN